MESRIGQKLISEKVITEEQLHAALQRQRLHGGRIGANLVALGYLTSEELGTFFMKHPAAPVSLDDTGLEISFIEDLLLKQVLFAGDFTLKQASDMIKLPIPIIDPAIQHLRRERLVEVKSASQYLESTFVYSITSQGRTRAFELLELNRYTGPAPVMLDEYKRMVEVQTIKNILVTEASVNEAFSQIIVGEDLLKRLGPAISSGKAIFLYGPPGNGKTTIAEIIGRVLPGTIYVPYSMLVGGQIITLFDPVTHEPASCDADDDETDQRWILVHRPVVMTGGELELSMLDLDFNPISKFYEASLQMKANNGLFIVDDFGRQQVEPRNLLNRWIVPLEKRTDFMTLHTGMKFDIPFDQLIIFATNIEPKDIVDEAFLRRIRYKIRITHPTEDEYKEIFKKVCKANGIAFDDGAHRFLIENFYRRLDVSLNACHPRDLIDHIIDNAHYYGREPKIDEHSIMEAWNNYFVET